MIYNCFLNCSAGQSDNMKSPEQSVAMPTVVRGALILLLLLCCATSSQTAGTCRKVMIQHFITDVNGCESKRLISVGCRGACFSYSRVSPRDYGVIERSCQCCQEVGYRTAKVRLACPHKNPPHEFVKIRLATDCMCRPCNMIGGVPNDVGLHDYFTD